MTGKPDGRTEIVVFFTQLKKWSIKVVMNGKIKNSAIEKSDNLRKFFLTQGKKKVFTNCHHFLFHTSSFVLNKKHIVFNVFFLFLSRSFGCSVKKPEGKGEAVATKAREVKAG